MFESTAMNASGAKSQSGPAGEPDWANLRGILFRFIRSRVDSHALADDLTQETLRRMIERQASLKHAGKLEAWAFQIARNAIADHFRKAKRPVPEFESDAADGGQPMNALVGSWLAATLAELPPADAEVLRLVDLEGLPQTQAARQLGLGYSGLKSRIQRARARLKSRLLECCSLAFDRRGAVVDWTGKKPDCCEPDRPGECSPPSRAT